MLVREADDGHRSRCIFEAGPWECCGVISGSHSHISTNFTWRQPEFTRWIQLSRCQTSELISEVVEIEKAQVTERAYPPGITKPSMRRKTGGVRREGSIPERRRGERS